MRERAAKGELADPFIVTTKKDDDKALIWQTEAEFRVNVQQWDYPPEYFMEDEFEIDLKAAGKRTMGASSPSQTIRNLETRNVVNKKDKLEGFLKLH
jgi:hypothetical protein